MSRAISAKSTNLLRPYEVDISESPGGDEADKTFEKPSRPGIRQGELLSFPKWLVSCPTD